MELTKLSIHNFFSFGEHQEITLSKYKGITIVKGNEVDVSNGLGKSSFLESIFWCLTGKNIRDLANCSIIRKGTNETIVSVSLCSNNNLYVVTRKLTDKSELKIFFNEKEMFFDSIKQAQTYIYTELLKMNYDLFKFVCFYGSKFIKFINLTNTEQASLVDLICDGEVFNKAVLSAKESNKKDSDILLGLEAKIPLFKDRRKELKGLLVKAKDRLSSFTYKDLDTKQTELTKLIEQEKTLKEKAKTIKISSIAKKYLNWSYLLVNKKYDFSFLKKYEQSLVELHCKISFLSEEKLKLKKQVEKIQLVGTCSSCGQEVTNGETYKKFLFQKINTVGQKSFELNKKASELNNLIIKKKKIIIDTTDLYNIKVVKVRDTVIKSYNKLTSKFNKLNNDLSTISILIDTKKGEYKELKKSLSSFYEELKNEVSLLEEESKKVTEKLTTCLDGVEEKKQAIKINKFWIKGFKDIKYNDFKALISFLEERVNSFCSNTGLLFDHIKFSTFSVTTTTNKQVPKITIKIRRGEELVDVNGLSEGEAKRVDLACFFGVRELILKSLNSKIDFLFLDEPLSNLDFLGKTLFIDLLTYFSEKKQVFLIDNTGHPFDSYKSIIINKKDKISTIYEST